MTVGQFFGTLQQSITFEWREHLKTNKYSKHKALNEYYEEMPELVDGLIEAYQSENDVVDDYECTINAEEHDALSYLRSVKEMTLVARKELFEGQPDLESLCDDVLKLVDSTIYKLDKLTEEYHSLSDFIKESLKNIDVDLVNAKLQNKLNKNGLGDIQIKKGKNGLYLDSNNPDMKELLMKNEFNLIDGHVSKISDLSDDEWIETINNILYPIN